MTAAPDKSKLSSMEFPCEYTLKVFGLSTDEFQTTVLMIVHKHIANLSDRAIQSRTSENGTYCSLSITIHAESQQQLDDLYRELTSCPAVLMAL